VAATDVGTEDPKCFLLNDSTTGMGYFQHKKLGCFSVQGLKSPYFMLKAAN